MLPNLKIHWEDALIKVKWYLREGRHVDQWNRLDSRELDLCVIGRTMTTHAVKGEQYVNLAKCNADTFRTVLILSIL